MSSREGIVYRSTGSWYSLKDAAGDWWQGRIKGKLRIAGITSTNPIAVGDTVVFTPEDEDKNIATISSIADRRNHMARVSPHNKNQQHIVAANLDLALVIATLASPRTSQGFIDRFLVTAEAYHIPALIILNKSDLALKPRLQEQLARWQEMYATAGYEVMLMNAFNEAHLDKLRHRITGQTTLFSGHSGVGKSTLINALIPGLDLRVNEISDWSGKGQHTTTFAEMYDLPDGGAIIDTPGVKEFGLSNFEAGEVGQYFPEIRELMPNCRFHDCQHTVEPGCAVQDAVANERLALERFESYLGILATVEERDGY